MKLKKNELGQYERTFKANGHNYTILSPEESLPPHRFTQYQKFASLVGFDLDFNNLFTKINEIQDIVLADEQAALIKKKTLLQVQAILEGMKSTSKQRYTTIFYICALFIIRDGEDMSKFVMKEAEQKIDDWNKAEIPANDFLELALSGVQGFKDAYRKVIDKQHQLITLGAKG